MIVPLLTVFRQIFAICLLSLVVTGTALADSPIAAVNTERGLAIKGYLITHYPQPSRYGTKQEHTVVSAGLNDGAQ
jgi:hypothetical protein